MKGRTTLRPAVSVPWYLPSRSSTQALCCGTTLTDCTTKTTAMMRKRMAISMVSDLFKKKEIALHGADAIGARLGQGGARRLFQTGAPGGATVRHMGCAITFPGADLHHLAQIQLQVGRRLGAQRQAALTLLATSSPDIPAAGRQGGHHGSRHQLDLGLKARMCRQSACHGPQRNHQQVKRSGRQFGYHQHACHQPPLRTFIHEALRFFLVLVQRPHRGQQNHHIARTG